MDLKDVRVYSDAEIDQLISEMKAGHTRVKVSKQGDVLEMKWASSGCHLGGCNHITKLDKEHYRVNATGEVREFQKNLVEVNGREQFLKLQKSLQRTFTKLRALINTNFTRTEILNRQVLFLTLTYAEQVEGAEGNRQLYDDFKYFIKKLNRKYSAEYGKVEYVNVVEPQGSGRWHMHTLLKWGVAAPFIPFEVLNDLWSLGYVKINLVGSNVKGLSEIDNLGAYLTAYLVDLPFEDLDSSGQALVMEQAPSSIVEKSGKRYVKGGRLWMYPEGMNIYRCSRGIKKPKEEIVFFDSFESKHKDFITYRTCKEVTFEEQEQDLDPALAGKEKTPQELPIPEGPEISSVVYLKQYYNLNRKKSQ